jgi:hypothetical protein
MATTAGEVVVDITANLGPLDAGLAKAKEAAVKTGEDAGKGFSYKFGDKFNEQAKGVIGALAGPMIASQLAKSAAAVLRSDKAIPDAILDGVKTIPWAGAFADLGSAIYDKTIGASDKVKADLQRRQQNADTQELEQLAAQDKARADAEERARATDFNRERLATENDLIYLRSQGDQTAIANAEYQLKLAQNDAEFQRDAAKITNDTEMNALLQLNREKRYGWYEEREAKLKTIADAKDAELDAMEKTADEKMKANQKEVDAIYDRAVAADKEVEKAKAARDLAAAEKSGNAQQIKEAQEAQDKLLRGIEKEKALKEAQSDSERSAIEERFSLEEETAKLKTNAAEAVAQSVDRSMSSNTALGSFTFDAYPQSEQKRVQEEIAANTRTMATNTMGFS